jgi:hypothetical protein
VKQATIQQPLLVNGTANRHERNNSTATRGYNSNGKLFSMRFVPICYKQVKLGARVSEDLFGE